MKALVFILIAVLSIYFVTSANHNKRHGRKTTRDNGGSDPEAGTDVEWPNPGTINDFTVPDEFISGPSDGGEGGQEPGNGTEIPPSRHHGKNRRRALKN